MSLRSKILCVLTVVGILYAAADNGFLRVLTSKVYGEWEREEGQEKLARVSERMAGEIEDLEGRARVWAAQDGLYEVVTGQFGVEELPSLDRVLDIGDVDVFYLVDREGNVLRHEARDPVDGEPMALRELPTGRLAVSHPLLNVRQNEEHVSGLMVTENGTLFVCARPIAGPDGEALPATTRERFRGALHGSVLLGRILDTELSRALGEAVDANVSILPQQDALNTLAEDVRVALTSGETEPVVRVGETGRLHLWDSLRDIRTGEPLILEVDISRDIEARRRSAVDYALLSTLTSAVLLLFVLLLALKRVVLEPLGTLTVKAQEIGRTDDTTIRTEIEREDEIGQLSKEFDRMLGKLASSRDQVVKTARLAGMSEIATGVLHNVGNVLNSVNVSANLVSKKAEHLPIRDLEMMSNVLVEHGEDLGRFVTDDPRGKHLVPFLTELSSGLAEQKRSLLEEVRSLTSGIDHMAELVRSQQTYAGTKGVFEKASLEDELDAAIKICQQALGVGEFEFARDYENLPTVSVDKHKLMEILVNLIQNARQAFDRSMDSSERRITLRLSRSGENARIEVVDNGIGISAENLAKIFHNGFTTKEDGHGFGLHLSANAATEMGGFLEAHSDGPGRGATFTLELPLERTGRALAA